MKKLFGVYIRGIAMGIADLIPGVSGGTIALLVGIYPRFIRGLASIDINFVKAFFSFRRWREYDIPFLAILGLGILSGILGGIHIVHYLLLNYLPPLLAFFAGLICASLFFAGNEVVVKRRFLFICGLIIGMSVSFFGTAFITFAPVYIFLGGFLAACAMLLPGISGSFILLLLGMYRPIIEAAVSLNFVVIGVFGSGVFLGIVVFSRVINFFLQKHEHNTMAILFGLMGGVLPRLWPWQAEEENIVLLMPNYYETATQQPAHIMASLLMFVSGALVVFLLHKAVSR